MKTPEEIAEIQNALDYFIGTESYHRLGIMPNVVSTDGVKWLAENAECFWLMDIIASYQSQIKRKPQFEKLRGMQSWTLTLNKTGNGAKVICTDGDSNEPYITQKIPFTDFPLQTITLWVQPQDNLMVIMLPSEH